MAWRLGEVGLVQGYSGIHIASLYKVACRVDETCTVAAEFGVEPHRPVESVASFAMPVLLRQGDAEVLPCGGLLAVECNGAASFAFGCGEVSLFEAANAKVDPAADAIRLQR